MDFMHSLGKLSWLITAVAAILVGLTAFNVDMSSWPLFSNASAVMFAKYIIGFAGVISLVKMVMWPHCNCKCAPAAK